ncbi:polyadenylate-binding protein 2-B [Aplysia californica]|uniref:Polyadenylate-binding protein 2-B n=1 Tax=Aplysia californica TaxID=6500 RepID=A0ABM0JQ82_APLCA|nr:polyadenylate-binding protein 2-B [Aplysia californica]
MADTENGENETHDEESSMLTQGSAGDATNITEDSGVEDPELEAIKARVREMEEEAEKLKEMQTEVDKQMNMSSPTAAPTASPFPTPEEKLEADQKSIYVGNVDYGATAEELEQHFHGCGSVNRVTILCDKFSGHPKGFAYIEFADKDSVITAMALDESLFRGRQIKVVPKRTNRPGISSTNRRPRGRGVSRGGRGQYYGGFTPRGRRPYGRFRRAAYYSPY